MNNFAMGVAMSGAIAFSGHPTLAQIAPDATLPDNSVVTPSDNTLEITGGTRSGGNLFHSFKEFSVPTNTQAFFNNSLDVQNIISRVTGGSISNIDGLIRANGTANLFLLNPNGIIFGPNASLNIGGSFLATTANSMQFADGSEFSAKNAQTAPLLTVSVPTGLQLGNASPIRVFGSNLSVGPGQTLAIASGEIAIAGGNLTAPGGRIELASIANGSLPMTVNSRQIAISAPQIATEFGDIQLSGKANVDASGTPLNPPAIEGTGEEDFFSRGGDIQVQGRRVTLAEGSRIATFTLGSQPGGNLSVNASESVELIGTGEDLSFAVLLVKAEIGALEPSDFNGGLFTGTFGAGAAGDLTINTRSLNIRNGAIALSFTTGIGTGGNMTINASDAVELVGTDKSIKTGTETLWFDFSDEVSISLPEVLNGLGTITFGGSTDAGNVTINTGRLTVRDRAGVLTGTLGGGRGGNLTVNALELVETQNTGYIVTGAVATGNAGNLRIITPQLNLVRRGGLNSSTVGAGNAGEIVIDAERIFLREGTTVGASTTSSGVGGNIIMNASESIEMTDGASVISQTSGSGNAGSVTITTPRLFVQGRKTGFSTATLGTGKGGDLMVNASQSVELIGIVSEPFTLTEETVRSILQLRSETSNFAGLTTVNIRGSGNAGNLIINTPRLIIRDGAGATTSTLGAGQGGNLTVNASAAVELTGSGGLITSTLGNKNAGSLRINTPDLILRDGAAISADTFGGGDAGDLTIDVERLTVLGGSRIGTGTLENSVGRGGNLTVRAESVELSGTSADGQVKSGLFGDTRGAGAAGSVRIEGDRLTVKDGAEVTVSGTNRGDAGNLEVQAGFVQLDDGSLSATTAAGDRGNISIQTRDLQMRRNSSITTNATGTATGGNIAIDADNIVALENSDITANAQASSGGQVKINTDGIFRQGISGTEVRREASDRTSDITATSELGTQFDGVVDIQTPAIDPTSGLFPTPEVMDIASLIPRGCAGNAENTFIITGRGGLPQSPPEALRTEGLVGDAVSLNSEAIPPAPPTLVEATGWAIAPNGAIVLIAQAPRSSLVTPPADCSRGIGE